LGEQSRHGDAGTRGRGDAGTEKDSYFSPLFILPFPPFPPFLPFLPFLPITPSPHHPITPSPHALS
ncbi:MAG TPA: hypothetical protein VK203_05515, partial [Nostocaceae cyanobacterium]|nr:hypothetical protein [Nostocaceae cyanobacterium]